MEDWHQRKDDIQGDSHRIRNRAGQNDCHDREKKGETGSNRETTYGV